MPLKLFDPKFAAPELFEPNKKPTGPVELDPTHWASKGLKHLFLFGGGVNRDIVSGVGIDDFRDSNGDWEPNSVFNGIQGAEQQTAGGTGSRIVTDKSVQPTSNDYTYVFDFEHDFAGEGTVELTYYNNNNYGIRLSAFDSSGLRVQMGHHGSGGNDAGTLIFSGVAASGRMVAAFSPAEDSTPRGAVNGVFDDQGTTLRSPDDGSNSVRLFPTFNSPLVGAVYSIRVYDRRLTDEELISISRNAYQGLIPITLPLPAAPTDPGSYYLPDARYKFPLLFEPNKKPEVPFKVDPNHWANKGLKHFFVFGGGINKDIVTGEELTFVNGGTGAWASNTVFKGIQGAEQTVSGADGSRILTASSLIPSSNNYAFVLDSFHDATIAGLHVLDNSFQNWGVRHSIQNNAGTLRCQFYHYQVGTFDGTSFDLGVPTGGRHVVAFSPKGSTPRACADGVLSTGTGTLTAPVDNADGNRIFGRFTNPLEGGAYALRVYDRQLTDAEMIEITTNYYQGLIPIDPSPISVSPLQRDGYYLPDARYEYPLLFEPKKKPTDNSLVALDKDNCLAPDVFCVLLGANPVDLVTEEKLVETGAGIVHGIDDGNSATFFSGATGTQHYISLPYEISYPEGTRWSFTWKGRLAGTTSETVFAGNLEGPVNRHYLQMRTGTTFRVYSDQVATTTKTETGLWDNSDWNTCVFDGDVLSLYKNGELWTSEDFARDVSDVTVDSLGAFYTDNSFRFEGWLESVYIHKRKLSAAEVFDLHSNPYQFIEPK